MAERTVLVVDPDRTFATQLSSALAPYGVEAQILTDGKDVPQSSPLEMPVLVLLCVEPKSVGYAICNKLKKSPLWKGVPVILMSAEATAETFEQHKKLKTRADDYIRKPFEMSTLIEKVNQLIGLSQDEGAAAEGGEPIEEIMLDDDEMAVVEEAPSPVQGLSDDDTEAALSMLREMPGGDDAGDLNTLARGAFSTTTAEYETYTSPPPGADSSRMGGSNEGSGMAVLGAQSQAPYPAGATTTPFFDVAAQRSLSALAGLEAPSEGISSADEQADVPGGGALAAFEAPGTIVEGDAGAASFEGGYVPPPLEAPIDPLPETGSDIFATAAGAAAASESHTNSGTFGDEADLITNTALPASAQPVATPLPVDESAGRPAETAREVARFSPGSGTGGGLESALKSLVPATTRPNMAAPGVTPQTEPTAPEPIAAPNANPSAAIDPASAQGQGDDAYVRELQGRNEALETERNRLRQELEEARKSLSTRPEGPTFQREREFLTLREQLNRKDRELLDLREQTDTKDRENLDLKEQARELERKRRELEERLLGVEQQILTAQEATSAVQAELAAAQKAAAEEQAELANQMAQARSQSEQAVVEAKKETESTRKQLAAEHAANRERIEKEHERALAALRDEHAGEVQSLHRAHEQALTERARELKDAVEAARKEMQEAAEQAAQAHNKELADAASKQQAALKAAEEQKKRALEAAAEQHSKELEAKANEARNQAEQQAKDHAGRIDALRAELTAERQQAEEAMRQEMAQAALAHQAAVAELSKQFEAQKAELVRSHQSELSDAQQTMRDQKMGMERRHLTQIDELKAKHTAELGTLSHELTQRDKELATSRTQATEIQSELASLRAYSSDLEGKLSIGEELRSELEAQIEAQQARIAELERQNSGFQEQVLKALGKIRSDAQLADKARRALAIAAALLEEHVTQTSTPAGADAAGQQKSSDAPETGESA